ncbi:MAG: SMC-Scp complex subunit ScpB [Planctomycetes bacterium]|nr:SMC-Scp complex subunit ScpB [Planctomycetota bacterium]
MSDSTQTSQSRQDHDADETACVEAVLFASDSPLTAAKIVQVAGLPGRRSVTAAIHRLNERYDSQGSAFRIEPIAGGYQMLTRPEYHDVLTRLFGARSQSRLSRAALETLAIVAYRQPVLRADIEAIRGVTSGEVLRGLMDKQLVKIVARAEVIGRPMLYGTTRRFLEIFGLRNLDDLPRVEELRQGAAGADKASSPNAPEEDSPSEQLPAENGKPE